MKVDEPFWVYLVHARSEYGRIEMQNQFFLSKKKWILAKVAILISSFLKGSPWTPMNNLPQEIEHLLTTLRRLIKGTQRTKLLFFFSCIPFHRESSIIREGHYKDTAKISYPYRTMGHVLLKGVHKSGWTSFGINLELDPLKSDGGEWDSSSIEQKWQLYRRGVHEWTWQPI